MTQSKKDDSFTIDISDLKLDDILNTTDDSVTINLDNTMGTTTTYWAGDSVTDITMSTGDSTFTLTDDTINIDGYTTDWIYNHNQIDPDKVERM